MSEVPETIIEEEPKNNNEEVPEPVVETKRVEFDFLTCFFFVTCFFFLGGGWVEAIPVTVVTLGPLDPLAI